MLKKLLKYDFRAIFRFWWIAVIISTSLSVVGGFAELLYSYDGWLPEVLWSFISGAVFLANCSYFALMVLTLVLLFIRFYKNFFSDEGYLTFTLPVHRKDLLKSKVITGFVAMTASAAVCGLNMLLMSCIGRSNDLQSGGFFAPVIEYVTRGMRNQGFYFWIYMVEYLALALTLLALVVAFLYFCITFGSMIVKKGKLITSIAIFYGASSIFISVALFLLLFGAIGSLTWWTPEAIANTDPIYSLFLAGLLCYLAALFWLLTAVQYWMLDKKLNLA